MPKWTGSLTEACGGGPVRERGDYGNPGSGMGVCDSGVGAGGNAQMKQNGYILKEKHYFCGYIN